MTHHTSSLKKIKLNLNIEKSVPYSITSAIEKYDIKLADYNRIIHASKFLPSIIFFTKALVALTTCPLLRVLFRATDFQFCGNHLKYPIMILVPEQLL